MSQIFIFCKFPEPGKVKTRLAKGIGEERAVAWYREMVEQTIVRAEAVEGAMVTICFAPPERRLDMETWLGPQNFQAQVAGTLGDRLIAVFAPDEPTLVIGTDCPGLETGTLEMAFEALASDEIVIGPSEDGGYYLLGAKHPHPELFTGIAWSTEAVLEQTLKACKRSGLSTALLAPLRDIDTAEDLALWETRCGEHQ